MKTFWFWREIKRYLLTFLTISLIACGAAMPFAVSWLQDLQTEQATEIRQFTPVSLTLQQNSNIGQVLQLVYNEPNWFSFSGATNLTTDEAVEAAKAALKMLSDEVMPLPLNVEAEVEIELSMVVSSNNSDFSALIWLLSFQNWPADNYIVFIDDASGKMVSLMTINQNQSSSYYAETISPDKQIQVVERQEINIEEYYANIEKNIEKWQAFCQKYYEIEIIDHEDIYFQDYWQCILYYKQNGLEEIYELPLLFTKNSFQLN